MSNDHRKMIDRRMTHDLVKDGLDYKSAKKLVSRYGADPITFSIAYNDAMNKLKGTNIKLNDNNIWPEFSLKPEDSVPPPFRIKSTYYMSVEQKTTIRETTWGM